MYMNKGMAFATVGTLTLIIATVIFVFFVRGEYGSNLNMIMQSDYLIAVSNEASFLQRSFPESFSTILEGIEHEIFFDNREWDSGIQAPTYQTDLEDKLNDIQDLSYTGSFGKKIMADSEYTIPTVCDNDFEMPYFSFPVKYLERNCYKLTGSSNFTIKDKSEKAETSYKYIIKDKSIDSRYFTLVSLGENLFNREVYKINRSRVFGTFSVIDALRGTAWVHGHIIILDKDGLTQSDACEFETELDYGYCGVYDCYIPVKNITDMALNCGFENLESYGDINIMNSGFDDNLDKWTTEAIGGASIIAFSVENGVAKIHNIASAGGGVYGKIYQSVNIDPLKLNFSFMIKDYGIKSTRCTLFQFPAGLQIEYINSTDQIETYIYGFYNQLGRNPSFSKCTAKQVDMNVWYNEEIDLSILPHGPKQITKITLFAGGNSDIETYFDNVTVVQQSDPIQKLNEILNRYYSSIDILYNLKYSSGTTSVIISDLDRLVHLSTDEIEFYSNVTVDGENYTIPLMNQSLRFYFKNNIVEPYLPCTDSNGVQGEYRNICLLNEISHTDRKRDPNFNFCCIKKIYGVDCIAEGGTCKSSCRIQDSEVYFEADCASGICCKTIEPIP